MVGVAYLSFSKLKRSSQQEALGPDHVLLPGELLFQPRQLLIREASAHTLGLARLMFEHVHACFRHGRFCGTRLKKR